MLRLAPRFLALVLFALLVRAPRATAAEPFFFIQLSDPQMGMFTGNADFAQDAANFEFAVAAVNRLRPAFVVITGDLVNKAGDAGQIAEYRRLVARIDSSIPVHSLAGNHDVGNMPTPVTLAAYTSIFGPDHYTFRHHGFVGVVLNSTVIHTPQQVTAQLREQDRWLRAELAQAKSDGATHLVVFQHHPWFIKTADEPDQYFNIPLARRAAHLALFHEFGVRYLFCGHYHRNAEASDGDLTNITTGPIGKPLGGSKSGMRIAIVRDDRIEHRFYELGELPTRVELQPPSVETAPAAAGVK
ncbi:MAG: hypothetical protein EXS32_07395 [Opitutus sp.]|nr:hypothetical protein [Opitutus sp.]